MTARRRTTKSMSRFPFLLLSSFALAATACSGGTYAFPDGAAPHDDASADGPTLLPDASAIDSSTPDVRTDATAAPRPVVLNEIAPNVSGGADLVELRALTSGSLAGFTLEQDLASPTLLATLPAINVAAGDLVVVHLGASSGIQSETSNKSACASATCYPNAWDVFGGSTGITFSARVLVVRDSAKAIVDGAAFYRNGLTSGSTFPGDVMALQKAGHWLPANCNGSPCSTTELAESVAADWLGVGSSGTGSTVARKTSSDTDLAGDWAVGPSTLGAPN